MRKVCVRSKDYVNLVCPTKHKSDRTIMHTIIKDNVRAYAKADRHGKATILDAITNLTGMHRKGYYQCF